MFGNGDTQWDKCSDKYCVILNVTAGWKRCDQGCMERAEWQRVSCWQEVVTLVLSKNISFYRL